MTRVRTVGTIAALALAAGALVFAGATLTGVGERRLGIGMMAGGVVFLVVAGQVRR